MELPKTTTESTMELQENGAENSEDEPKELSFKEQVLIIKNNITVEPVIFAYILADALSSGASNYLPFEMACRVNLGLDDAKCSDFETNQELTINIQEKIGSWINPLSKVVPVILVLCFGSFSDRYQIRKPFIILPILGEALAGVLIVIATFYRSQWPVEVYYVITRLVPSFFGGTNTFIMAIYSYISDISTEETRTARIGFVELAGIVVGPFGIIAGSLIFEHAGYYSLYGLCIALNISAASYAIFGVKAPKPLVVREKNLCVDIFNIKEVLIDIFKVLLRNRPGYKRTLLFLTYICYILIQGPGAAEGIYSIYFANVKFNWGIFAINSFYAYNLCCGVIAMFLAVTIFSHWLKMHDFMISAIACITTMISGIWYTFIKTQLQMWLGPVINLFSGVFVLGLRSAITKLVDYNEVAQAQSIFGITELIAPIIFNPIYAVFDEATEELFYGSFYLLTSALMVLPLILLMIMYVMHIEAENTPDEEPKKEENGVDEMQMVERF